MVENLARNLPPAPEPFHKNLEEIENQSWRESGAAAALMFVSRHVLHLV